MMLRRKRNKRQHPSDEIMQREIQKSEEQRDQSAKELVAAKKTASLLQQIREQNHIVHDLREVFGGR